MRTRITAAAVRTRPNRQALDRRESFHSPKKRVLTFLLTDACLSVALAVPSNIIAILGVDIGYDDIGCYGSTNITPHNIDSLAAGVSPIPMPPPRPALPPATHS